MPGVARAAGKGGLGRGRAVKAFRVAACGIATADKMMPEPPSPTESKAAEASLVSNAAPGLLLPALHHVD